MLKLHVPLDMWSEGSRQPEIARELKMHYFIILKFLAFVKQVRYSICAVKLNFAKTLKHNLHFRIKM